MQPSPRPSQSELVRARKLVVTKRRATLLLAVVAVIWLVVTIVGNGATWAGYVQATAEASMVGGLADWFAVTALFRRPLGLPIPHTAIITERKDQFGATLGDFIQESFLTPEAIVERVRAARVVDRAAAWLAQPANAERLAGNAADAIVTIVDFVASDMASSGASGSPSSGSPSSGSPSSGSASDEITDAIAGLVRTRLDKVAVAPLAGRALAWLTQDGHDAEFVDSTLRGIDHYLDAHGHQLRARLGERPWWMPSVLEERLVERLLDWAHTTLAEMVGHPEHPLRRDMEAALTKLATDLETSPVLRERGEQLKRDFLSRAHVADWAATAWRDAKDELRAQAADPTSELRRRLAAWIASGGVRLAADEALKVKAEDAVETAVVYVAGHFNGEIAGLVSSTISRWDAAETSRRLELLLGPDLQYIRINGTVVGAGAGLVLYALSRLIS